MQALTLWVEALQKIINEIDEEVNKQKEVVSKPELDLALFFKELRPHLFIRLSVSQVEGMEAKLKAFQEAGWPVSWAAYAMATSYHETGKRMVPVREGFDVSDAWRKRNLRYFPWYGRGDVQLTWEDNYKKADTKLGLNGSLVHNLDLALDKDISAKIMVRGMEEGWFSGDKQGVRHTLKRHLPDEKGTKAQFKQSRRIINLMDKADLIANYALGFQDALISAGYKGKEV